MIRLWVAVVRTWAVTARAVVRGAASVVSCSVPWDRPATIPRSSLIGDCDSRRSHHYHCRMSSPSFPQLVQRRRSSRLRALYGTKPSTHPKKEKDEWQSITTTEIDRTRMDQHPNEPPNEGDDGSIVEEDYGLLTRPHGTSKRSRTTTAAVPIPPPPSTTTTTTTTSAAARNPRTKTKEIPTQTTTKPSTAPQRVACLPRTLESARIIQFPHVHKILGIDEAGRGPLAGPVVSAAVWAPMDLDGIVDSKQITKEEERERLYEELIRMPQIEWAVAVMDAATIDTINILQATLEGMRLCATALVIDHDSQTTTSTTTTTTTIPSSTLGLVVPIYPTASIQHQGCYVVRSTESASRIHSHSSSKVSPHPHPQGTNVPSPYYALVDGNRVPRDMPCLSESVIKGDGKEFMIAAASILAKVTRDRLMNDYDKEYPEFNLKQHKGYPTASHRKAVATWGASPIHRRSFAPLKNMELDEHGKVLRR